jgi:hypothetical protein
MLQCDRSTPTVFNAHIHKKRIQAIIPTACQSTISLRPSHTYAPVALIPPRTAALRPSHVALILPRTAALRPSHTHAPVALIHPRTAGPPRRLLFQTLGVQPNQTLREAANGAIKMGTALAIQFVSGDQNAIDKQGYRGPPTLINFTAVCDQFNHRLQTATWLLTVCFVCLFVCPHTFPTMRIQHRLQTVKWL